MGSSLRWGPCHSLILKPLPFCRKEVPVEADTLTTVTGLSTKFSRVTGGHLVTRSTGNHLGLARSDLVGGNVRCKRP